jgi:hypothetical protein
LVNYRKASVAVLLTASLLPCCALADSIYRWTDADGVIHISSEKPPKGVQAERIEVRSSPSASRSKQSGGSTSSAPRAAASPEQVAAREEVLGSLRTRECVIALESLDRLTSGGAPTSAAELKRLQQTADLNCSKDPGRRQQQEAMAAKLRVANGPQCVEARNRLAALLEPAAHATREQVKSQQDFVDTHCTAPVR